MSNILVTGGCGYIGSRLVEELLNNQENKVVVLDSGIFGFDSLNVSSEETLELSYFNYNSLPYNIEQEYLDYINYYRGLR